MLQLLDDVVALKAENAALREEIARLKGLKGPPKLKPSGMEKATEPARAERKAGRRGGKIDRLVIDEERVLKAAVPPGPRFKGYETYVVQELILRPHVIRYRRERWISPLMVGRWWRLCPRRRSATSAPSSGASCSLSITRAK